MHSNGLSLKNKLVYNMTLEMNANGIPIYVDIDDEESLCLFQSPFKTIKRFITIISGLQNDDNQCYFSINNKLEVSKPYANTLYQRADRVIIPLPVFKNSSMSLRQKEILQTERIIK